MQSSRVLMCCEHAVCVAPFALCLLLTLPCSSGIQVAHGVDVELRDQGSREILPSSPHFILFQGLARVACTIESSSMQCQGIPRLSMRSEARPAALNHWNLRRAVNTQRVHGADWRCLLLVDARSRHTLGLLAAVSCHMDMTLRGRSCSHLMECTVV